MKKIGRGVTLVELLTVLGIVSLLSLLILPAVKGLLADRKGTQAATIVRNFLEAARARSIGTGRNVAVVFERISSVPSSLQVDATLKRLTSATVLDPLPANAPFDTNFSPYNTCIRMSLAEQPLPLTDAMLGITPAPVVQAWQKSLDSTGIISWAGGTVPPAAIRYRNPSVPKELESDAKNYFCIVGQGLNPLLATYLVPGCEITLKSSTSKHIVLQVETDTAVPPNLWFSTPRSFGCDHQFEQSIGYASIPVPSLVSGSKVPTVYNSFTIFPSIRPINGPAVQLPKGMCIDLSISGFSSEGNVIGRDSRLRFSSAWLYTTSAAPEAQELRPPYVVFGPDGSLSRVYANNQGSALIPVESADDLFLHIGKIDKVVIPHVPAAGEDLDSQNLTDPSGFVVRISAKSGGLNVAPSGNGPAPTNPSVGDVLAISRQTAFGIGVTGQ
jgi:type II secretory pathway pseudopilin PulG